MHDTLPAALDFDFAILLHRVGIVLDEQRQIGPLFQQFASFFAHIERVPVVRAVVRRFIALDLAVANEQQIDAVLGTQPVQRVQQTAPVFAELVPALAVALFIFFDAVNVRALTDVLDHHFLKPVSAVNDQCLVALRIRGQLLDDRFELCVGLRTDAVNFHLPAAILHINDQRTRKLACEGGFPDAFNAVHNALDGQFFFAFFNIHFQKSCSCSSS